jgi:hypothetical protein
MLTFNWKLFELGKTDRRNGAVSIVDKWKSRNGNGSPSHRKPVRLRCIKDMNVWVRRPD